MISLGLILVMLVFMALHWRNISDAIGFQLSRKRMASKKQSRTIQVLVWVATWAIAAFILTSKCNVAGIGIFCGRAPAQHTNLNDTVSGFVNGNGPGPVLPFLSTIVELSGLVQSNWFYIAFLGFLIFSSVIVARGLIVSWKETRTDAINQMPGPNSEGAAAVEDALRILRTRSELDPRTRIINCYERMVEAAQRLGATVTIDQTARELETSLRKMLGIKTPAIRQLTNLFEEARYSLHSITENDAENAQQYLENMAEEMNIQLSVA